MAKTPPTFCHPRHNDVFGIYSREYIEPSLSDCLTNMSTDQSHSREVSLKRKNCINWEDYFMATAILAAKRSKDPARQVGACVVNGDNIIVGVGYNGLPRGCKDDEFPWGKHNPSPLDNKYFYVCHAEMNAILNGNPIKKNCRIYVTLFPCNECVKLIIQAGINEVIYMSDKNSKKNESIAARKMLDAVKINYRQLKPIHKKIIIDFDEVNRKAKNQISCKPEKSEEDEMTNSNN